MTIISATPDGAQQMATAFPPRVGTGEAKPLPGWAVDACHLEHPYPSHRRALLAVALAAVNAGWERSRFWGIAEDLAEAACREDRKRGRQAKAKALGRAWDKATQRVAASPAVPDLFTVRRTLADAAALADRLPWKGQAGNGDRATLAGVLRIAEEGTPRKPRRLPSLVLALSARDVAEAAGVGKSTAARALARLTERGWLVLVEAAKEGNAARYRLRLPVALDGTPSLPVGEAKVSHLGTHPLAALVTLDAFAPRALGRSGARVLAMLDPLEPQTPAALAERLGLTVPTVRRALRALEAVGAAWRERQGRGFRWSARVEALEADRIAEAYGTAGRAERRALEHDRDREGYAAALEHFRHRRAAWRLAHDRERSLAVAVAKVHRARAARVAS